MEKSVQPHYSNPHDSVSASTPHLQLIFNETLRELYFAKDAIHSLFLQIQNKISSPQLLALLTNHYRLNLNQKKRLEKIFSLQNITLESKDCLLVNALVAHTEGHLKGYSNDLNICEITLILTTHKLAHYKIASYGAATHLAIRLNHTETATLLAISVQEEEEFIKRSLDEVIEEFLCPEIQNQRNTRN